MAAYFNEIDPLLAQWLRNLIAARLIATGSDVDRSPSPLSLPLVRSYDSGSNGVMQS
jgi:hypothetical protein